MAEFKLYPRMLYHESFPETKRIIVVQSAEEQYALGRGWFNNPGLEIEVNAPPPPPVVEPPPPPPPSPVEMLTEKAVADITPAIVSDEPDEDAEMKAFLQTPKPADLKPGKKR